MSQKWCPKATFHYTSWHSNHRLRVPEVVVFLPQTLIDFASVLGQLRSTDQTVIAENTCWQLNARLFSFKLWIKFVKHFPLLISTRLQTGSSRKHAVYYEGYFLKSFWFRILISFENILETHTTQRLPAKKHETSTPPSTKMMQVWLLELNEAKRLAPKLPNFKTSLRLQASPLKSPCKIHGFN